MWSSRVATRDELFHVVRLAGNGKNGLEIIATTIWLSHTRRNDTPTRAACWRNIIFAFNWQLCHAIGTGLDDEWVGERSRVTGNVFVLTGPDPTKTTYAAAVVLLFTPIRMTRTHGARVVGDAAAAGPNACVYTRYKWTTGRDARRNWIIAFISSLCFYARGTIGGRVTNTYRAEFIVSGSGGRGENLKDRCVCVYIMPM